MLRRAIAGVVFLVGLAMPVAAAQATFHLEKVNEVMLASGSGDSTVQFVELLDKGGTEESFPPIFAPYKLVVYNAAGTELGEQTLNPTGLRNAATAGTEYLIATPAAASAFGVTADEPLNVSLPLDSAQVCYRGSPGNISCITYGSITQPVPINSQGSGSAMGPVPPNGESDQRQGDDSIQAAPPTPKAVNRAGAGPPPTPPAGTSNPPGGMTPSFAGVRIGGHFAKVDRRGRALVSLSCPAGTSGNCAGHIVLTSGRRHVRVGRAGFALASGGRGVFKVKLSITARTALARRSRLTVRASVVATDAAGHQRTITSQLTLRR
jgi:hypothetical protein